MKRSPSQKPPATAAPSSPPPGEKTDSIVNPFSPKDDFQKYNTPAAKELQSHTNSPWLRVSLDAALSQLAAVGADNRELRGARRFIETLLDLPEKDTPAGKLPQIKLETYDA